MHRKQKTTFKKRTDGFLSLAGSLGVTSSGLRRYARRGLIPGAALIRGRWILRGPLTPARVEALRQKLPLNPFIHASRTKGSDWNSAPDWFEETAQTLVRVGDMERLGLLVSAILNPGEMTWDQLRLLAAIPKVKKHLLDKLWDCPVRLEIPDDVRNATRGVILERFPEASPAEVDVAIPTNVQIPMHKHPNLLSDLLDRLGVSGG